MQSIAVRKFHVRVFLALTLLAWLAGAAWHGAMRVGVALGQQVCTLQGAKYVPGGTPAQPGPAAGKDCPLCAAFGAPASVSSFVADASPFVPFAASVPQAGQGAVLPASHLADLASRAPPRA